MWVKEKDLNSPRTMTLVVELDTVCAKKRRSRVRTVAQAPGSAPFAGNCKSPSSIWHTRTRFQQQYSLLDSRRTSRR